MSINICSMFRDSQNWEGINIDQVNNFFCNIFNQKDIDFWNVWFDLIEGNSKDNTLEILEFWRDIQTDLKGKIKIIKQEVDGSSVKSVVSPDRFKNLSSLGNKVLNSAKENNTKYIFWMESDLVPPPNLLSSLLKWTQEIQWDQTLAIAPIPIFTWNNQKLFYDTWAFEGSNGEKWSNHDLNNLANYYQDLRPMRSIGSAALLNADLLRKYNIDFGEGCFPELCRLGRNYGLNIYCDTTLEISHPSSNYISGRMI